MFVNVCFFHIIAHWILEKLSNLVFDTFPRLLHEVKIISYVHTEESYFHKN